MLLTAVQAGSVYHSVNSLSWEHTAVDTNTNAHPNYWPQMSSTGTHVLNLSENLMIQVTEYHFLLHNWQNGALEVPEPFQALAHKRSDSSLRQHSEVALLFPF